MKTSLRRHVFALLPLALILGGIVGWLIGVSTTCATVTCQFSPDLFGAWGSWVGGLTTATAAGVAAFELWSSRQDQLASLTSVARSCALRVKPLSLSGGKFTHLRFYFDNRTSFAVTELAVRNPKGEVLDTAALALPGAQPWGKKLPAERFGLPGPLDESGAVAIVNRDVQPFLIFEFTIGRTRFRRVGTTVTRVDRRSART